MELYLLALTIEENKTEILQAAKQSLFCFPTLYAKAKNGNIRVYNISVEDLKVKAVLTTKKQTTLNGKITVDTYSYTEGVNLGKANESTYIDKALFDAKSIFNKLLDKGFTESIPTKDFNTDSEGNMKPMLAHKWEPKYIKFPCICQPKYDGVRSLSFKDENGKIHIRSRQGKDYNLPHLEKWLSEHEELLPLDGELYNHNELSFQDICSAVKRQSDITPKIRAVVYDKPIKGVNNKDRMGMLIEEFKDIPAEAPYYFSSYEICCSLTDVKRYHDKCVSEGYEGAIIRNMKGEYEFGFRSNDLIKLKVFNDEEFEIIDIVEATGRDSGTAVFVLKTSDGIEFRAKPQGSHNLREKYFNDASKLIGKMCTVQYQGLSDDGVPRFPSAIAIRDYE